MKIIIASDIFGKTPELEEFAAQISIISNNAVIIDPYEGEYLNFRNEDEAHRYFKKWVGIDSYKETVYTAIANIKRDLYLIGFSVGASAIWATSDRLVGKTNTQSICFYGSQIRNYVDVNPEIYIELIFPKHEAHFSVSDLSAEISLKNNVVCDTVIYLHGFMNKRSANFNNAGFEVYVNYIKKCLA